MHAPFGVERAGSGAVGRGVRLVWIHPTAARNTGCGYRGREEEGHEAERKGRKVKILGKLWALSDNGEQAEMLNQAGADLRRACAPRDMDWQISFIVDKLDRDGCALVKKLADMVRSEEENRRG